MLMQYLPENKRKGDNRYRHGDFIQYDDRPTSDDPEQVALKEKWDSGKSSVVICVCSFCHREYYQDAYFASASKYCSQRCVNDAYMERRSQRHEKALQKICVVCGKEYHAKKVDSLYCSRACKQKAYRERIKES